jgi:indole-3-glycerol phosphate synthase
MTYSYGIPNTSFKPLLKEIIWQKKLEIAQLQQEMSLASLQRQLMAAPTVRDFLSALQQSLSKPGLIAEIKQALPDRGLIRPNFDPVEIAKSYERGGASCLAIVTDQKFFQGSFDDLRAIRYRVVLPILCKDFILDPCQIYLARAAGADAILLVAALLSDMQIQNFLRIIHYLGMNAVIEVHNLAELDRVLKLEDSRIVSINNASLLDSHEDLNLTQQLIAARRSHLQNSGIMVVSDSGIETSADLTFVANAGSHAVIVGEPLLIQHDLEKAVRNLLKERGTGNGRIYY